MTPIEVVLQREDLVKFFPSFGTIRPGWKQSVTVTYTLGKDPGSQWNSEASELAGLTLEAKIDESTRQLTGKILIDADSASANSAVSAMSRMDGTVVISNLRSLSTMREGAVRTLVHELLHVLQGWVRPGGYDDADRTAFAKAWGKDLFMRRPEEFALRRYYGNVYEQAAFSRSQEFVKANRAGIQGGLYDCYLPVSMLQNLQSQ